MTSADNSHNLEKRSKSSNFKDLKVDRFISYQSLDTPAKSTPCTPKLTEAPLTGLKSPGTPPALQPRTMAQNPTRDGRALVPIANAIDIPRPDDAGIPNEYEFELMRLRRRVAELESAVTDRDDKLRQALHVLDDELVFWHTGLNNHVWESMGGLLRRVGRLESALAYIKEQNSRFYPSMELPDAWRKGQDR